LLQSHDEPESLKILKDKVGSLMPRIDSPELLLEANRMTGFTDMLPNVVADGQLRPLNVAEELKSV
jgi:hypothetical protein